MLLIYLLLFWIGASMVAVLLYGLFRSQEKKIEIRSVAELNGETAAVEFGKQMGYFVPRPPRKPEI